MTTATTTTPEQTTTPRGAFPTRKLRDYIAKTFAKREHEAAIRRLNAELGELEPYLIDHLAAIGVANMRTDEGTAYVQRELWARLTKGEDGSDVGGPGGPQGPQPRVPHQAHGQHPLTQRLTSARRTRGATSPTR